MRRQTLWRLPPPTDALVVRTLTSELGLRAPVARVLAHRGFSDAATVRRFLNPSIEDLHDPFQLADMRPATARVIEAIRRQEQILLYGDYDADGISAAVILKKTLELAGGKADICIPHRLRDGYGMREQVIEQAATSGVRLIISLDTGIRAASVVGRAKELGVDVIVTDHHLPDAELPPAFAVLNPKRLDCTYPEKDLCGAGVAFKLVQALLESLGWPQKRQGAILTSLLKLVAIATVADVVSLTGENRILVKHGLEGLRSVRNPGLRALLDFSGIAEGEAPSAGQVAFRVAPRMNAAGRMADAAEVAELLLTDDPARAREIAARLHALNQERQQAETSILKAILDACSRSPVGPDQKALVFSGPAWHRGVVGVVAGRLLDRFHRPVVVLGEDHETGLAQGSGRSIPQFHLLNVLESMPDLLTRFGGHRQAAGLTLPVDRIGEFRERLNQAANLRLTGYDLVSVLEIDAELSLADADDTCAMQVLSLGPFGYGNRTPLFAVLDAEVASPPTIVKDRHLRVRLRQGAHTLTLMGWDLQERAAELQASSRVDIVMCFQEDTRSRLRGYPAWSAAIQDVRPVG